METATASLLCSSLKLMLIAILIKQATMQTAASKREVNQILVKTDQ